MAGHTVLDLLGAGANCRLAKPVGDHEVILGFGDMASIGALAVWDGAGPGGEPPTERSFGK